MKCQVKHKNKNKQNLRKRNNKKIKNIDDKKKTAEKIETTTSNVTKLEKKIVANQPMVTNGKKHLD